MATAILKRRAKPAKPLAAVNGPQVYSYGRFSRDSQAKGDSERRQTDRWEDAKKYAASIGLPFNESIRMFDRGKSAFHGHHITKGVFGPFLECIKQGEIVPGSVLVVEEIDRVSRLETTRGLRLVLDIVDSGVTIYTPGDDTAYTSKSLNQGQIWKLVAKLETAHEESQKKSDRLKSAWEQKRKAVRENGKVLTSVAPEWLERVVVDNRRKLVLGKNGKPVLIPAAAKSIILAFQLREKGLGEGPIARHLNAKAPWSPPPKKKKGGKPGEITQGWNASYVKKILMSRAVIGECQPCHKKDGKRVPDGDLIPDHWPNIFAKHRGVFDNVQRINKANVGKCKGGRNDKANNLLQKLVKCAYCGGTMQFYDKGSGWTYLKCQNGIDGKTKCVESKPSIRYSECEDAVIEQCRRLRPEQVLPNEDEQAKLCESLRQRLQRDQAVEQSIQDKIDSVNEQILVPGATPKRRAQYEEWLDTYDAELAEAKQHTANTENELNKAEHGRKSLANWQANIEALQKALDSGDVELRQRMNVHLKEFIDRIEVFTDGLPADYEGDDFGDYFDDVIADIEHQHGRSLKFSKQQRAEQNQS